MDATQDRVINTGSTDFGAALPVVVDRVVRTPRECIVLARVGPIEGATADAKSPRPPLRGSWAMAGGRLRGDQVHGGDLEGVGTLLLGRRWIVAGKTSG